MNIIIKKQIEEFIEFKKWDKKDFNVILNKEKKNGDFSTNFCFIYSKISNLSPCDLGNELINFINKKYHDFYENIVFSKPGYVNFYLKNRIDFELIQKIIEQKFLFPIYEKNNKKINVEFVSANPTGKLHLAHAYAAIFGNTLVNVFKQLGYNVQKEFYINDAGNQIDKLALSVLIRYLQLFDIKIELYEDSYHGEEIIECARKLKEEYADKFINTKFNEDSISDHEVNDFIKNYSKNYMLKMIKDDLSKIGVDFDLWTSEKSLYESGEVDKVIQDLEKLNKTYISDHATWLKSSEYGDDKDRVLKKGDGNYTYLVPDIALHVRKLLRNYDEYYNIWGMDHHSYISRLKIALEMLGFEKTFEVIPIQVMKLTKNGNEFKLSKRSGTSLTLQELIEHIGKDELKWICTSFQTSTHKIIEVEKITKHDNSNPLFYVEYASARLNSIFEKNKFTPTNNFEFLNIEEESLINMVNELSLYEKTLEQVIKFKETNTLTNYLYKLANRIHEFYNKINIQNEEDNNLKETLLHILYAAWIILHNGLSLIGIKAYEKM